MGEKNCRGGGGKNLLKFKFFLETFGGGLF